MYFEKFKIYESNIWKGECNHIKVIFRPSVKIPANTIIDISNVKNSTTGNACIYFPIQIREITNNDLSKNATWIQSHGRLSVLTENEIPTDKDTSFIFTVRNKQSESVPRGGYFADISSSDVNGNNLLSKASNKIMSCDVNKSTDPSANYFLWFNYGGIVTGPYSEEYAPIGTEGTYEDDGDRYGKDISRNSHYYFNDNYRHQSKNWKDIYDNSSNAMPNRYSNLVIGDMQYEQVFLNDLDTLGAISISENKYIDNSKNQGFFSGTEAYRKVKSDDAYANYRNRRATRLNGDDPDRNIDKIFTNDSYDNLGATTNSNDIGPLEQSIEFNKEYFIDSGLGSLLIKNGSFSQHTNSDLSSAKYKTDSTLGTDYYGKTLEEMGEQISFKFTQNRHPPIWDRDNIKFTIKEIKESNNAQEAFNTIYVRLRPNRDLPGNSKIIITDLSGTITPNNENLDISGTNIFIGDSGNWAKDLSNGTLKLEIEQSKIMSKDSITEFNFVLINRNEGQNKIKPKIKVEKNSQTIIEEDNMNSGDGILDASMAMIYMIDISKNKYRMRNVKNNVFDDELDFILLDEKYKVKFDFTDPSITNFENERFKFDLSGPNFRKQLNNTLVKVYPDISCVILDISRNINIVRNNENVLVNHGLSGEDIIIFDSSNNTVDNSGVIYITEKVNVNTQTINDKKILIDKYPVPENIKKRFIITPLTKPQKKKNNLLRHRTIENIFKSMKGIDDFKTTPQEIGITHTKFEKQNVKIFKINSQTKMVSIIISKDIDKDTGFYVPLSSGESISITDKEGYEGFKITRKDVNGEARYTTTGTVSETTDISYSTINYFVDDETAIINDVFLYFGGILGGLTQPTPPPECVNLTNCCSCDEKPKKKDESTLTENTSNTSRRISWARLSAFNRKSSGRAAGSRSKQECGLYDFSLNKKISILTTAATSNNELVFASVHGLVAGTAVTYTANSVISINGLISGNTYYVLDGTTTSTMKLAVTSGGTAITIAQGAAGNKITSLNKKIGTLKCKKRSWDPKNKRWVLQKY